MEFFFPKTKVTFFVIFIFTSMVALAFGESCPLSYKLKLQNPDSGIVEIEIIYDQPPTNELIMVLGEGGFDTAAFINAISNFEAVNEKGAALPIKSSISDGEGKYASIIQIDVNNAKTITMSYQVDLNAASTSNVGANLLKSSYGVIEPEYVFYRPVTETYDHFEEYGGQIDVSFELPIGWPVITLFAENSNVYQIENIKKFIFSPIAFGDFHTETYSYNNSLKMKVAFQNDISKDLESNIYGAVTSIFEYFNNTIGDLSESKSHPRDSYIIVFLPPYDSKVSFREWAYGYTVNADPLDSSYWGEIKGSDYAGWQAHMIGHAWFNGAMRGPFWFFEGINTFYQFRTVQKVGIISQEKYQTTMVNLYEWYVDNINNTVDDISISEASNNPGKSKNVFRISYWKAALVGHILNETMELITTGTVNLDDIINYLFTKYAINSADYIQEASILEAINKLSGYEFSAFFDAYIFGTDPLPCHIENDQLLIDYAKLPDCPKLGNSPLPDIKADGSDDPTTVSANDTVSLKVSIDPGDQIGQNADWWIAAETPFGWFSYIDPTGWKPGIFPYKQGGLISLSSTEILNTPLPKGDYTFYFAIDDNMDGTPDATWYDSVSINISDIIVDGKSDDWINISPVITDQVNDSLDNIGGMVEPGTDIKNIYLARDSKYLYVRFDLEDGDPNPDVWYQMNFWYGQGYSNHYDISMHFSGSWITELRFWKNNVGDIDTLYNGPCEVGSKMLEGRIEIAELGITANDPIKIQAHIYSSTYKAERDITNDYNYSFGEIMDISNSVN